MFQPFAFIRSSKTRHGDQIVITEKSSQAKDVRAAVGSRYGDVLAAEGHLLDLLEPEDVVPAWKRWSPILLRPEGLYGTRPAEGGNKAAKLRGRAQQPSATPFWQGVAMGTDYQHLTAEERATLMVMRADGCSQRAVARCLGRSPSTISRELARNASCCKPVGDTIAVIPYDASLAGKRALVLRQEPRRSPKLAADTALFAVMLDYLREGWSPEQIAGRLKRAWPDDQSKTVSHETIYTALYAMPRGGLRKDLIACLRHGRAKRRPRSRGQDRRGQISDMLSLHVRPPEVEDRLVPGHWEGDLIKGARNQSAVGTLVERTSRLVLLARMEGATAEAALAGFTCILNRVHMPMRKTLTYDQGKEMSRHKDLTAGTGVTVYFADPHSPWQRGSNENTNGLLRHYLPKGTDLSGLTQEELDAIARKLNTRPRKLHGFRSPIEVYDQHLAKARTRPDL